jgi:DNA-binding transcriptional ArsR family regulator
VGGEGMKRVPGDGLDMSDSPSGDIALPLASVRTVTSPTRLDILRCLRERRLTVTEVADAVGIPKSTAHAHLAQLQRAGFVERPDEGERLWVRYGLTPLGAKFVSTDRPRVTLILGAAVAFLGAAAGLIAWRARLLAPPVSSDPLGDVAAPPPPSDLLLAGLALGAGLAVLAALVAAFFAARRLARLRAVHAKLTGQGAAPE